MVKQDQKWLGEVRGRVVKTVIVTATSRKEAERKLKNGGSDDCEGVDTHFEETSRRIVGKDQ